MAVNSFTVVNNTSTAKMLIEVNGIHHSPINKGTSEGRIPARVSDKERAIVAAGFANDVDAVNQ